YSISDSTPDDTFPGREGINGFPFLSVPDPRTPLLLDPVGSFDGATPLWDNLRYGGRASPITVATGVEARLIEAEAALAAGQTATFFTQLNNRSEERRVGKECRSGGALDAEKKKGTG